MATIVEKLVTKRQTQFFDLVRPLSPAKVDELAGHLETAIAKAFAFASEDFRRTVIPAEWHSGIVEDLTASNACHAPNEALFSILGNYCKELPHHITPMKYTYPGDEGIHRFNISAYSGKIFDTSRAQMPANELEMCAREGNKRPYGKNGFPRETARMVIHLLNDTLEDDKQGKECFGKDYKAYKNKLGDLVKTAAEYWPLKEERSKMGINFYNRTPRQARNYSNRPESFAKAVKSRKNHSSETGHSR